MIDYFKLLEVNRNASLSDLKIGFYRQAKRLHPDVNVQSKSDPEAAKIAFQELTHAFTTLKDPTLRQAHCLMLDMQTKKWSNSIEDDSILQNRHKRATYERTGDIYDYSHALYDHEDGWLLKRQKEFHAALAHAYVGPRFEPNRESVASNRENIGLDRENPGLFPYEWECEERSNSDLHPHILQVVSGRQLLGHVEAVYGKMLSDQMDSKLEDSFEKDEIKHEKCLEYVSRLEFVWLGKLIAVAVSDTKTKNLLGEKGARINIYGLNLDMIDFQSEICGDYKYITGVELIQLDNMLATIEPREENCDYLLDSMTIKSHKSDDIDYFSSTWKTPGVRHCHCWATDGPLEFRARRAWLPDSKFWYFEPRSDEHNIGGWYVERIKLPVRKNVESTISESRRRPLNPAIYILAIAHDTLQRETKQEKQSKANFFGNLSPVFTSVAGGIGSFVSKLSPKYTHPMMSSTRTSSVNHVSWLSRLMKKLK